MQSSYIREVSKNYHDFTQKKLQQTNEEIPFKFRGRMHEDQYIKKPPRKMKAVEVFVQPPKQQKQQEPSCWECCLSCNCQCSCSKCCQPELCQNCVYQLCKQCKQSLFLKASICKSCQDKLCLRCRKNVWGNKELKLRSYPIRMKRQNQFHFQNCKCHKCRPVQHMREDRSDQ